VPDRPPLPADAPAVPVTGGDGPGGLAGRNRVRGARRPTPFRVLTVALVVAVAVVAVVLTRPSGPAYRTAVVSRGDAVATLAEVGTVTPVQQANLTFTTGGKVGAVNVTVGQQVSAGQVVASLDPSTLESAVVSAAAGLASARATLAADESAQSATASSSSTGSSSGSATSPTTAPSGSGGGSGTTSQEVAKLQAALVADQTQQDADATAAGAALSVATSACTAVTPPSAGPSASGSSTSGTVTSGTPAAPSAAVPGPGGGAGGGGSTGGSSQSCTGALAAASTAHAVLVSSIARVTRDESALATALGLGGTGTGSTGTDATGGAPAPSTTTSAAVAAAPTASTSHATTTATTTSSSSPSSGTSSGRTRTITPQQLALDQADVDVAQATLDTAQQNVGESNLVSPITGTVGSVALTTGETVPAGSPAGTPQVVVIGSGTDYEVTTSVPVTSVARVAVGQPALVTPDSGSSVLAGTVTGVGVLGTASATTTTYPVTIAVRSTDLGSFSGADASVAIVTRRSIGVTTVPTSAVTTVGTRHRVLVVDGGTTRSVPVTVGTVGTQRTQILTGVTDGQVVALAVLSAPVPTSSTTTRGGLAGLSGAGGFSGAGRLGGTGGPGGGGFGGVPGG